VVAGEEVTERALQMAEGRGVILVKDGRIRFVEQALQRYG
jgi:DNA-directed RNA polymerase subunit K/omega